MRIHGRSLQFRAWFAAIAILSASCGKKSQQAKPSDGSGSSRVSVAPIALPVMGVDALKAFNFVYDAGAPAYQKAIAAYKATPRDWTVVQTQCEAALAKDPRHLDAHRLLASALAQQGKTSDATEHLLLVFAADWSKYGATYSSDADLAALRATPHGAALTELVTKLDASFRDLSQKGLWVIGRRSTFKMPAKVAANGSGWTTSRGEIYAFDQDSKRFLRLTHTDHQVAAFVRSNNNEVAVLTFDKVEMPAGKDGAVVIPDAPTGKGKNAKPAQPVLAPSIGRSYIQVYDAATMATIGPKAQLPVAREIWLGYGAGDQLLVKLSSATSRWQVTGGDQFAVDKTTGKLIATSAAPLYSIKFNIDEGESSYSSAGFETADPVDEVSASALISSKSKQRIAMPDNANIVVRSINAAPDGSRAAFATAIDACNKDLAPSLYVADAAGAVKHVLTSHSRFATRWLSASLLAYEDDDNGIRVWDAVTGREQFRIVERAGLALSVLSSQAKAVCKSAPIPPAAAGSDDIEVDPVEGAMPTPSDQPVVAPQ
jgi:hypothetical protein